MKLAIADPPYLGRAALWYGAKGKQGSKGRARGRGNLAPEYHPDAHHWDHPQAHIDIMANMNAEYDGWVLAASVKTLDQLLPDAYQLGARLAIWHVTNAIPDGARVRNTIEAVLYRVPDARRAVGTGFRQTDHLSAPHPIRGFVGSKPDQWNTWVLDLLGYNPQTDTVDDIFPGAATLTATINGRLI